MPYIAFAILAFGLVVGWPIYDEISYRKRAKELDRELDKIRDEAK